MNRVARERFNCPVLGGMALVQITKQYLQSDESPQPELRSTEFSDCRDKLRCGIAIPGPSGFTFDWGRCPAYTSINKAAPPPASTE